MDPLPDARPGPHPPALAGLIVLAGLTALIAPLIGRPGGAPVGFAGAPGQPDCRACHIPPAPIAMPPPVPPTLTAPEGTGIGDRASLALELSAPTSTAPAHGFALEVRDAAGSPVGQVLPGPGAAAWPGGLGATHAQPEGPGANWSLRFAPSSGLAPGSLRVHAAWLQADGDGTAQGDQTFTDSLRLWRGRLSPDGPITPGGLTRLTLDVPHRAHDVYVIWLAITPVEGPVDRRLGPFPLVQQPEVAWLPYLGQSNGLGRGFLGMLDAQGRARAEITWPAGVTVGGLATWWAAGTIDPVRGEWSEFSNPLPLSLP